MQFENFKDELIDNAYSVLINSLTEARQTNKNFFKCSITEVEYFLIREICQEKWKEELFPRDHDNLFTLEHLKLELNSWVKAHPLFLPLPVFKAAHIGIKLGISAVLGGIILGSVIAFIICQLLLSFQPYLLIYAVTAPIASGLSVWFVWCCTNNCIMRKITKPLLILLKLSIKKPNFDNPEYKEFVKIILNTWINMILKVSRLIIIEGSSDSALQVSHKLNIEKLLVYIYKLFNSNSTNLRIVASEIITFFKMQGFEGFEQQPSFLSNKPILYKQFIWNSELELQYDTIGIIEEGDKIIVESVPIIKDEILISKGTARKART